MSDEAQSIARTMADVRRRRGTLMTLRRLTAGSDVIGDFRIGFSTIGPDSGVIDVGIYVVMQDNVRPPMRLTEGIDQNNRRARFSEDEIIAAGWPAPPREGDKLIEGEDTYTVLDCKQTTMDGVLLSYTLSVKG